jgi:hypothetical protein
MYVAFQQHQIDGKTDLNNQVLTESLRRKIPIVKTMQKQLEYLIKWVGYDKTQRDGVRARFANNEVDELDTMFTEILEKQSDKDNSCSGPQQPQFPFSDA